MLEICHWYVVVEELNERCKVKQPYLTSMTCNSNSTDKAEVDGGLICLHSKHLLVMAN